MKHTKEEIQTAREYLLSVLKPGDTVYCVAKHESRSGMSRTIDLLVAGPVGNVSSIAWAAARLGVGTFDRDRGGLKIGGAGMDMGFALVYDLSTRLFPDGFGCVGERCPSNDHSNGDRDYTPHHGTVYTADTCPGRPCSTDCDHKERAGRDHWHRESGYALTRRWL